MTFTALRPLPPISGLTGSKPGDGRRKVSLLECITPVRLLPVGRSRFPRIGYFTPLLPLILGMCTNRIPCCLTTRVTDSCSVSSSG